MSCFRLVLIKELKSMIRDPKLLITMLIVPLIITGAMYFFIVSLMQQTVQEALRPGGLVIVVDEDKGFWAKNFTEFLKLRKYNVVYADSLGEALQKYDSLDPLAIIVVLPGFSENITNEKVAHIEIILKLKSISISKISAIGKILDVISDYSENVSAIILREKGVNPEYTLSPVSSIVGMFVKEQFIQAENIDDIIGPLIMMNIFIPIIIVFLAGIIAQLSATSIAVEKEEKMLETLLSLPMNRLSFIVAKIAAATIAGLLGVFVYGGLMLWYFSSLASIGGNTQGAGQVASILNVVSSVYGTANVALLIVGLIGVVLLVLGLGILLALFVDDVRSAQIASSYIIMPMFFVVFVGLFLDVSSYSQIDRILLALIPMANIGLMQSYIFIDDAISIYVSVLSSYIYALIVMYIASRMINTEKIFTLKLFKKKRGLRFTSIK